MWRSQGNKQRHQWGRTLYREKGGRLFLTFGSQSLRLLMCTPKVFKNKRLESVSMITFVCILIFTRCPMIRELSWKRKTHMKQSLHPLWLTPLCREEGECVVVAEDEWDYYASGVSYNMVYYSSSIHVLIRVFHYCMTTGIQQSTRGKRQDKASEDRTVDRTGPLWMHSSLIAWFWSDPAILIWIIYSQSFHIVTHPNPFHSIHIRISIHSEKIGNQPNSPSTSLATSECQERKVSCEWHV